MKIFNKNTIAILAFVVTFIVVQPEAILAYSSPAPVNLGTSGNFTILSKTGVSTTGTTSVVGDIGVSPAQATYITGFALTLPAASAFSTSALVSGKVYAPGYASPTPAVLSTAVLDMQNAYTDAAGRAPNVTELGAGNIGGLTLAAGVYKWGTGLTIPTDVTLSGSASDVWIFQVAQNLNVSSAVKINLTGGAQAGNVFWVVAGQTTIGTTALFNGNILDQTAIVLNTGATLNGRALAQSAVTLDSNTVTVPSYFITAPTVTPTYNPTPTYYTPTYTAPNPISYPAATSNSVGGCSGNNLYNTSTGAVCVNNMSVQISGCGNRATGFSTATGQSCAGNRTSGTTYYNLGTVTLKSGSRGEAVMELQRFLNARLNLGLAVDGKLGPKTITVIKQWQNDNGLVADGLIGAKTKAKMNAQAQ